MQTYSLCPSPFATPLFSLLYRVACVILIMLAGMSAAAGEHRNEGAPPPVGRRARDIARDKAAKEAEEAGPVDPTLLLHFEERMRRGRGVPVKVVKGAEKKQQVEVVDVEGALAAKLTWLPDSKDFMELRLRNIKPLLGYPKGITLSFEINKDHFPGLRPAGVRLLDANGETWQFGFHLPPAGGWKTAKLNLDRNESRQHWGGSDGGRGRMDLPMRLAAVLFKKPKTPVTEDNYILLRSIRRTPWTEADIEPEAYLAPLNVSLQTATPVLAVVPVGREDEFALNVMNPETNRDLTVDIDAEFESLSGRQAFWTTKEVALKAGETVSVPLGKAVRHVGLWRMKPVIRMSGGDGVSNKPVLPFAYMRAAGTRPHPPGDGFWFGIDARIKGEESPTWIPPACALIGMDIARGGANWPYVQPESMDQFTWEKHRELVDLMRNQGISTCHSITFTPNWAAQEESAAELKAQNQPEYMIGRCPPREDALRNYIRHLVPMNKELGIHHYDLWNEPDLMGFWRGSTEDYLTFMRICYEEVKKLDPDALVLTGGIAKLSGHSGHRLNPDLIQRMIVENQDYYDAISLHDHGEFPSFVAALDGPLAKLRKQLKTDKPLYFTETGAQVRDGHNEMDQANTLIKKISFARARGAIAFLWFAMNHARMGNRYNMMSKDGRSPRPVYVAYNTLVNQTRGKRFHAQHDVGLGNWLLSFRNAEETCLVGWDEDSAASGQLILIRPALDRAPTVYDALEEQSSLPIHEGLFALPMTKGVKLVALPGPAPEVLGPLVRFKDAPYGEPGRKVTIETELYNPLERDLEFGFLWTHANGTMERTRETVKAEDRIRVELPMEMPTVESGQDTPMVRLDYVAAGTPWSGTLRLPVHVARLIPAGAPETRAADFVMETHEHIFNANEDDPNRAAYTWQGMGDLSARAWLRLEGDALEVTTVVKDDIHKQPHDAQSSWMADGIQLAMAKDDQPGFWKIGLARSDQGETLVHVWNAPAGHDATAYAERIQLTVAPEAGGLRYVARLPLDGFGNAPDALQKKSIAFNLIVNDDDGGKREGFAFVEDGLGRGTKVELWPRIIFE